MRFLRHVHSEFVHSWIYSFVICSSDGKRGNEEIGVGGHAIDYSRVQNPKAQNPGSPDHTSSTYSTVHDV
jgi:hypothetical protein